MKSHSVGAELFHVDGQTDRHDETVAFRKFLPTEYQTGLTSHAVWKRQWNEKGSNCSLDRKLDWFHLARYILHRKKFTFLTFFLSFLFWPLLPTHSRCRGLLSHLITLRHTTVSRTSLDEGSARRRDLYLITHNIPKRHPRPRRDSNPQSQQVSGRRPTP